MSSYYYEQYYDIDGEPVDYETGWNIAIEECYSDEIKECEKEIETYEKEIYNTENAKNTLKEEIENLKIEIEDLKESRKTQEELTKKLKLEISKIEKEIKELNDLTEVQSKTKFNSFYDLSQYYKASNIKFRLIELTEKFPLKKFQSFDELSKYLKECDKILDKKLIELNNEKKDLEASLEQSLYKEKELDFSLYEASQKQQDASENIKSLEKKLEELKEKKDELDLELSRYLENRDEAATVNYHQIFRIDVDGLLKDFYDKTTNTLNFDELLKVLSKDIDGWVARHEDILEAVLDTSFFEEHEDFFEKLYDKKLIDDKDLLKIFERCGKFGEYLFVRDHTDLMLKILKEVAYQSFSKEPELKYSLEELCDRLIHYATHNIYNVCSDFWYGANDLEEESLDDDEIDYEFVELLDDFRNFGILTLFDLTEEQKSKLIEVVKTNELAQNKLKNIVDNHLEDSYSFDSLMQYLKKSEKKNILNI